MITKSEVVSMLTAEETAEFRMWEAKIDSALRTHNGETCVPVTAAFRVRIYIVKAYELAGWTVVYHDDQREGASLTFA